MNIASFKSWLQAPDRPPLVMGILNVTPDSFSDGGQFASTEAAVRHAREMVEEGADLIDVGGESTRPGSQSVSEAEQIARVVPVIKQIAGLPVVISIDTTRAAVAQAAFDAGAHVFNDISGGTDDPAYFPLAARLKVPVILMHMQGRPHTMQTDPQYSDVTREIFSFLQDQLKSAESAGIAPENLLVDPGIGFGKTMDHTLTLLRELRQFRRLGRPLLLGVSRKGFIGKIVGETEPKKRVIGSVIAAAWCVTNGADIVRVHDVRETVQAVKMIRALEGKL